MNADCSPPQATIVACLVCGFSQMEEATSLAMVHNRHMTRAGVLMSLLRSFTRKILGTILWHISEALGTSSTIPGLVFIPFHTSLPCFLLLGIVSQINYLQVSASSSNFMGIKKQLPQFRKWRKASKNSDFHSPWNTKDLVTLGASSLWQQSAGTEEGLLIKM